MQIIEIPTPEVNAYVMNFRIVIIKIWYLSSMSKSPHQQKLLSVWTLESVIAKGMFGSTDHNLHWHNWEKIAHELLLGSRGWTKRRPKDWCKWIRAEPWISSTQNSTFTKQHMFAHLTVSYTSYVAHLQIYPTSYSHIYLTFTYIYTILALYWRYSYIKLILHDITWRGMPSYYTTPYHTTSPCIVSQCITHMTFHHIGFHQTAFHDIPLCSLQ